MKNYLHLAMPKPLDSYSDDEWEALCDGCGLCCTHKAEDIDTGEIVISNVACKLLDCNKCTCTDYDNRFNVVPDCTKITPDNIHQLNWLPPSCAYRTVARGEPLPMWHYIICGDKEKVHMEGISMKGELISETEVDLTTLEAKE